MRTKNILHTTLVWVMALSFAFIGMEIVIGFMYVLPVGFVFLTFILAFFLPFEIFALVNGFKFSKVMDMVIWFGLWSIVLFLYIYFFNSMSQFQGLKNFLLSFLIGLTVTNVISLVRLKRGRN